MLIANLTPEKEYYPTDLKNMQNILRNPHLTTTIQHDTFRPTVQAISEKSERLSYSLQKILNFLHLRSKGIRLICCVAAISGDFFINGLTHLLTELQI